MNTASAEKWGRSLAAFLVKHGKQNPFVLALQLGWRVVLENAEERCPGVPPRLAEWDGRQRTIRLFLPMLQRYLGASSLTLQRACAHELFHGLASSHYRLLPFHDFAIPKLNHHEEEMAAHAFSEALLQIQAEEEK